MLVEAEERMLLATDLHLGIEYELAKMGISIPYQTDRFLEELLSLIREHRPDRLLLLGDIKHGVPIRVYFNAPSEHLKSGGHVGLCGVCFLGNPPETL